MRLLTALLSFRRQVAAVLLINAVHGWVLAEEGWFAFKPKNDVAAGVIGMADWLDRPAGSRGRVAIDGDRLTYADGTTAQFWGVNNCNQGCAPPKSEADQRALWYAKYGINAVRQHKFMQTICAADDATTITPENQELFDYYFAALKKQGIYSGWSPIWFLSIKPGNKAAVTAGDELLANVGGSTASLVNFAPDLQQLHIDLLVKLLKHRNPFTKLTYAEDPALLYVEIQNEDDIFWWSTETALEKCPTYKKMLCKQFCAWLRARYQDQAGLVAAWGDRALNAFKDRMTGEALDQDNIYPNCNPWFVGPDGLKMADQNGTRRRLLDAFAFLAERQSDYYAKAASAIRTTGYKGPLIGSPWQAGEGIAHYYNLHCDQEVGVVDRHNYFGGGTPNGWQFGPGKFDRGAMVAKPGSGLLSTGLQLVAGRPFSLSEWDTQLPNEWMAEGAPIIAAYGMGLQGWSMSYQFASDGFGFSTCVDWRQPWGAGTIWNANVPCKIGLYPALARMLYRGDVTRAPVIATRNVSMGELRDGKLGLVDHVKQEGDVKALTGSISEQALAVGRVAVRFTDNPTPSDRVDLAPFRKGESLISATKQLAWTSAGGGSFTVDTPGTKAVVGFAAKRRNTLGAMSITVDNPFAVVFVTSLERGKDLATTKSILVSAVSRSKNTGMRLNEAGDSLEAIGASPLLVEGVQATIDLGRHGGTITALDHDGMRSTTIVPIANGVVRIDGCRDQAIYYEIRLP